MEWSVEKEEKGRKKNSKMWKTCQRSIRISRKQKAIINNNIKRKITELYTLLFLLLLLLSICFELSNNSNKLHGNTAESIHVYLDVKTDILSFLNDLVLIGSFRWKCTYIVDINKIVNTQSISKIQIERERMEMGFFSCSLTHSVWTWTREFSQKMV